MTIPSIRNIQRYSVFINRALPYDPAWWGSNGGGYTLEAPLPPSVVGVQDPTWSNVVRDRAKYPLESWSQIRKSGAIKMTPYYNKSVTTTSRAVYVPRVLLSANVARNDPGTECGEGISRTTFESLIQTKSTDWPAYPLNGYWNSYEDTKEKLIKEVKSQLFANASSDYDVLTELAESKETVTYVMRFLREGLSLLKSLKKHPFRTLGDAWLQYRYAITPLLYSAEDIARVVKKYQSRSRYYTYRSKANEILAPSRTIPPNGHFQTIEGSIVVRGVCKKRYNVSDGLGPLVDLLAMNPLKTGWELVPLSFVVDWFINIGDVLSTLMYVDWAADTKCCISVKEKITRKYYYRDSYQSTAYWPHTHTDPQKRGGVAATFSTSEVYQIAETREESYDRFLHDIKDVDLVLAPFLNWKRWLDATALSRQSLSTALRRLK